MVATGLKRDIALAIGSLLFAVYLTELVVLSVYPQPRAKHELATERELPFDNRSKLEVIRAMERDQISVIPLVSAKVLVGEETKAGKALPLFPLAGTSSTKTVACNEGGFWSIYDSDEHGFNNPPGLVSGIDPTTLVLIGDSFLQGACVSPGDDIAGRMRSAGHRAVSLGVGGAGPLFELAILREYAAPGKPATVLWFYYEGNDLRNLRNEERSPTLLRYREPDFRRDLRERQVEIDGYLRPLVDEARAEQERREILDADPWRQGHYNAEGYDLVAQLVLEALARGE